MAHARMIQSARDPRRRVIMAGIISKRAAPRQHRPRRQPLFWPFIAIALAAATVYANSLSNPFMFDDLGAIVQNTHIRSLATALSAPPETPLAGRPVVSLTFALNYAMGGLDVTGYRLVNLALHIAC